MRDLIIIRGPQGSGKSTLARECGLEGHHLSFDKVREVISGDAMGPDGRMGVSQQHNQLVFAVTMESIARRMHEGQTVLFEATMPKTGAGPVRADGSTNPSQADKNEILPRLLRMAKEHGYRVLILDLYTMPADLVKARNADRPERVRVSDFSVDRCYAEAGPIEASPGVEVMRIYADTSRTTIIARVECFLHRNRGPVDLSGFDRVVLIGDIQGTCNPLVDPASPLAGGLRKDTAYIFCGDLFDRGVQNDRVARFWLEKCHPHVGFNVWLVGGNHEDHVEIQARGGEAVSREWRDRTWPQVEAAGFTNADMATIAGDISPYVHFFWRGVETFVSHGGFPVMPREPHLLSIDTLRRGAGEYGRQVDARWDEAQMALPEDRRVFQVHGHRNSKLLPVIASANGWSINLEGGVEMGGHLRFVTLDVNGWTPTEIRSKEYRTMTQAHQIDQDAGRKPFGDEAPMTPWALRGDLDLHPLSDETLAKFRDHSMIGETVSETRPNVSSWNFTKSAFFTQNWDQYTSVARGLFIDNIDNTVVSRGAPKFYNTGERPETTVEAVLAGNHGVASIYLKENGFFSTVGYSERLGELVVTSKSRIEGTFPDMANEMIDAKLGASGRERMLRFCRDQKACLMFEVVDMARDPHIIREPGDKLVLLACIRRDETFEQVPFSTLERLAKWIGCDVKECIYPNITHPRALESIIRRVESDAKWRSDAPAEGVVIEFADGFMVKGKGLYYASWKKARGAVERLALARRKDVDFDATRYADVPLIGAFLDWAQTLPVEALGLHIIELRDAWTGAADARYTRQQVEEMGPRPGPKVKDMSGFIKALEGMATRVEAGQAKPDSVVKMLASGANDPDKQGVIDTHPAAAALRAFVSESCVAA